MFVQHHTLGFIMLLLEDRIHDMICSNNWFFPYIDISFQKCMLMNGRFSVLTWTYMLATTPDTIRETNKHTISDVGDVHTKCSSSE